MDEARKERIRRELKKAGLFSQFDNDIFGDSKGQCKVIVVISDDRMAFRYQGDILETVVVTEDGEFIEQCERVKDLLTKKAEA